MNRLLLFVLVGICLVGVKSYEKSYSGYELIEILTSTDGERSAVLSLGNIDETLDFWYESHESFHIFVPPEKLSFVKRYLDVAGLTHYVINDHIQRDIEEESARLLKKKAFDIDDFNTFEDIAAELNNMAARCRSDLGVNCEVYSAGKTSEGRDIWILKLSKDGSGRKGVWLDATIHAREWLATATHLKIMAHLIDDYPTDATVRDIVDTYDWYFNPVANPDGYAYTWSDVNELNSTVSRFSQLSITTLSKGPILYECNATCMVFDENEEAKLLSHCFCQDRMWRKNRTPNSGSTCIGTDLNRNYDQMWGNAGASTLPCSETFRGSGPASELETQAIQAQALQLGPTLATSVHLHTYAQYWLIPWGSYADGGSGPACNIAADHDEMLLLANPVADAIQNTYGTTWERGNSCQVLYPASGLTMDYFKGVAGVKYTALPELRGNSFVVAKSQIPLSFNEVWNGLVVLFDTLPELPQ